MLDITLYTLNLRRVNGVTLSPPLSFHDRVFWLLGVSACLVSSLFVAAGSSFFTCKFLLFANAGFICTALLNYGPYTILIVA